MWRRCLYPWPVLWHSFRRGTSTTLLSAPWMYWGVTVISVNPAQYTCSPTRRISNCLYYNGSLAAGSNGYKLMAFLSPNTRSIVFSFSIVDLTREKDCLSVNLLYFFIPIEPNDKCVYIFSTCIYILNFFLYTCWWYEQGYLPGLLTEMKCCYNKFLLVKKQWKNQEK